MNNLSSIPPYVVKRRDESKEKSNFEFRHHPLPTAEYVGKNEHFGRGR